MNLEAGTLMKQGAKYHLNCLADLYRKADKAEYGSRSDHDRQMESTALSSVIIFIKEKCSIPGDQKCVFKLSDLRKLYSNRLAELGATSDVHIHSTRLKNRILDVFPTIRCYPDGKEVLLAFDADIGEVLGDKIQMGYDAEGVILAEAAKIIRR